MNFHQSQFLKIRLSLGLIFFSAIVLGLASTANADWSSFEEIKKMYYNRGQQKAAIEALEDEIESSGAPGSQSTLTGVLDMMKDYFTVTKEYGRFQTIIYNMLEPDRIDEIVDHFKRTPMYDAAKKARQNWLRPAAATIRLDSDQLDINESTSYTITATNQKGKRVSSRGLTIELDPSDYAKVEGGKIIALQSGKITVIVKDSDGNPLTQRDVNIMEGLAVSITPDYKQLEVNESENFVIQSNKPFSKFDIKIVVDSRMLVGSEFPADADANKKRIRVTAKKSGTGIIKVTDVEGNNLAQATVYVAPKPPSMMYPLIGSVVTVGAGVFSFLQRGAANDKFDEHTVAAQAGKNQEAKTLFDDYESKLLISNIGWIVTGVVAAGTGYLWYKYLQDKREYERKLNEDTRPVSFHLDPHRGRVSFLYKF